MNSESSRYKVRPSSFNRKLEVPSSKSHANRALIIGAVRGNEFRVDNLPASTDVKTMIACLEQIGLKLERIGSSVIFHNSFPQCENESADNVVELKTGDGGTTNRFLLALLSRGKKTYRLIPSEKMSERPMDDLLEPLRKLEVSILKNKNGAWLEIQGPASMLHTSRVTIDCSESTQFASAMILAFSNLPLAIDYTNVVASKSYLKMTEHLLKQSQQKNSYRVPVDFSSAGYPIALALVSGEALLTNCKELDPFQADSYLIDLMNKCGGRIEFTEQGLKVSQSPLTAFKVDGGECPDLIPTLAFLAAHCEGESELHNLSVLRHKESDRLEEIIKLLTLFQIPFHFDKSSVSLRIQRSKEKAPILTISTARDHRMVMMAYMLMKTNSGGLLYHTDFIEKSFPDFMKIMEE